jgi:hypothetical protein
VRPLRISLCAGLALATAACGMTQSNKLDEKARAASVAPENVAWKPATRADVVGYFESDRITGEAAASLRKVFYSFAADGTYSGAALVQEGAASKFQVLSGAWRLEGNVLDLGPDSTPAKAQAAPGRLRLDSEGGSAVFHKGATD